MLFASEAFATQTIPLSGILSGTAAKTSSSSLSVVVKIVAETEGLENQIIARRATSMAITRRIFA